MAQGVTLGTNTKISIGPIFALCFFLVSVTSAVLRYHYMMDQRLSSIEARLVGASQKGWHREQMVEWVKEFESKTGIDAPDPMDILWWDVNEKMWRDGSGRVVK